MKEKLQYSNVEENETDDSDRELQIAFQKGYLKPGLNVIQPVLKKTLINNVSGLKAKLIELKKDLDWIERLDVTVVRNSEPIDDAVEPINSTENDFHRECSFISQAQSSVATAIQRLHKLKILTKRPDDYFAEMVKSDQQMKKVREKLLNLQTSKQRSETARRLREERKFAANVQKEVALERQREKRELMDAVKKHKKGVKDRLNEVIEGRKNQKSAAKKRSFRDTKYGFGGQKKRSKWNTAESAADYSSFSAAKFSKSSRGDGRKKRNAKKPQRPGKNRRAKMKNSQGRKKR